MTGEICTQLQTAAPNGNSPPPRCYCGPPRPLLFCTQKTQPPGHCRTKMSPSNTNKINNSIKLKNSGGFLCLLSFRNTSKMLNESRSGLKTSARDAAAPSPDRLLIDTRPVSFGSTSWRSAKPFECHRVGLQVCPEVTLRGWSEHLAHLSKFPETWVKKRTVDSCGELPTKPKTMCNIYPGFRWGYWCEQGFKGRVQKKKKTSYLTRSLPSLLWLTSCRWDHFLSSSSSRVYYHSSWWWSQKVCRHRYLLSLLSVMSCPLRPEHRPAQANHFKRF